MNMPVYILSELEAGHGYGNATSVTTSNIFFRYHCDYLMLSHSIWNAIRNWTSSNYKSQYSRLGFISRLKLTYVCARKKASKVFTLWLLI